MYSDISKRTDFSYAIDKADDILYLKVPDTTEKNLSSDSTGYINSSAGLVFPYLFFDMIKIRSSHYRRHFYC
jgi:hypothetical protein